MKNESEAIERLTSIKSKVSSHYLIKNSGEIVVMVPDLYEAWHAGISSWKSFKSLNKSSIGIEISNPGHNFNYKNFSKKQIQSIKDLSKFLIRKYKIDKKNILGHSDIAPFRKIDPGPKFPWYKLSLSNLVFYPSLKYEIYIPIFKSWFKKNNFENNKTKCIFILCCVGYDIKSAQKNKSKLKKILLAYQMHFIPSNISGRFDKITTKYLMRHYLNLILTKN